GSSGIEMLAASLPAGKESPKPGRQLAWRCGSSGQASQAPQKRDQGILLVILQAIEPTRFAARLAGVATDRVEERDIRPIVHEPRAEAHAPQRRSAKSVGGLINSHARHVAGLRAEVLDHGYADPVAGANIVQ